MGIDSRYLFGLFLVVFALAGCSAGGDPGEIPPANETMYIETSVDDTDSARYIQENDTVKIKMTGNGDGKEIPFQEYACREGRENAREAVDELVQTKLDDEESDTWTVVTRKGIGVRHIADSGASTSTLERITPDDVLVDVRVFEKEHECTVPVEVFGGGNPQPLDRLIHRND